MLTIWSTICCSSCCLRFILFYSCYDRCKLWRSSGHCSQTRKVEWVKTHLRIEICTFVLILHRFRLRLAHRTLPHLESSCRLFGRSTLRHIDQKHYNPVLPQHPEFPWIQGGISITKLSWQVFVVGPTATQYRRACNNGREYEGSRTE